MIFFNFFFLGKREKQYSDRPIVVCNGWVTFSGNVSPMFLKELSYPLGNWSISRYIKREIIHGMVKKT